MRDQIMKQRSECKGNYVMSGDYPESFQNLWGSRKVSDYSGRKAAAYGMYLIMNKELEATKKQLEEAIEVIKFYGDLDNSKVLRESDVDAGHSRTMSGGLYLSGKRAREFLNKLKHSQSSEGK